MSPRTTLAVTGCCLACTLFATAPAAAQRLVVDGHRLPLQADTFTVLMAGERDTTVDGQVIDLLVSDGRTLTRIHEEQSQLFGRRLDTVVMRLDDLGPISRVSITARSLTRLRYEDGAARGTEVSVARETTLVNVRLDGTVYDGQTYDLVVRAAELGPDLHLVVPSLLETTGPVGRPEGRVIGSDSLEGADCWVFQGAFGGLPVRFWIDKQTRALRREQIGMPGGPGVVLVRRWHQRTGPGT